MEASGAASFLNGLRPAQTPNFVATLSLGYDSAGKGAQIIVRHVGAQYDDDLNVHLLKAATTVDAFGSWPLAHRLELVGRVENLFDKVVMTGINGGSVERATPRTLWIGLRLR
jgi:outer membrane receptor protein involved in Fe transport